MRDTDRRVKYTKMVLRESLLELLQEKPISRISVTELCQNADVNRGTFYAHYSEPADLLRQIEDELFEEMRECFEETQERSLGEANANLMNILARNREMCKVVIGQNASTNFLCRLKEMGAGFFSSRWKCKIDKLNLPEEYLYHFITTGNIEIIRLWVLNDDSRSPSEIARIITELSYSVMHACNQEECCK